MSTHKHFNRICCVVLCLTLVLTVLFINAEKFGIQKASTVMGYEKKLFDTSKVHSINIIMDDWDDFTANCQSEEYYSCTVVIDNEAYKNVAIRGKGNTSLAQVASYGNNRYSFKIEFDHYDSSKSYYGLDKLCLNNIIQDNTYMKDYLSYTMMNYMGVASPLCSYAYITVNGDDWGLYLAVEGIEESFLQRNYGKNYGELYKPDSQNMGGGRGNGEGFDMDKFINNSDTENTDTSANTQNNGQSSTDSPPQPPNGNGQTADSGETATENFPNNMTPPNGMTPPSSSNPPDDMTPPSGFGNNTDEASAESKSDNSSDNSAQEKNNAPSGGKVPENSGGMTNGSDDVLLKYIDDEISSYSNIFDNAKTDASDSDKNRLISALKKLSSNEDLDSTVDVEKVIKYFVVHNFVLNFDSYTGSMIHNYYLYENNGQMQMIPWDYNLAFGGFQSMGGATSLVNYPIDSPVSGGNAEDRPMIAWIFASDEYTELYHKYFSEFISKYFDSGYFEEIIDSVKAMISPYVEKDPTKFCTYDEFEKGIDTLKEFCLLRAESVSCQLDGTIGSTSDTQKADTLIDAGDIQISDMGSMNNTMGSGNFDKNAQEPPTDGQDNTDSNSEKPSEPESETDTSSPDNTLSQKTDNQMQENAMKKPPDRNETTESQDEASKSNSDNPKQKPDSKEDPNNQTQNGSQSTVSKESLITAGASAAALTLGIVFALVFKRRRN